MSELSVTRRDFAKKLATGSVLAGAATVGSLNVAEGQEEQKQPPKELPKQPRTPVDAVAEWVQLAYPQKLEAQHMELIRDDIEVHLLRSVILSNFPLSNADEPGTLFAAYRSDDRKE